jgi:hypothetical protein
MAKKKILSPQKESSKRTLTLKADAKVFDWDPAEDILKGDLVQKAFFECLMNNDPEGAIEVIDIYLITIQAVDIIRQADIPRSSFCSIFKTKNPRVKTLAKIISARSFLVEQEELKKRA